jgi:hypothetical protein
MAILDKVVSFWLIFFIFFFSFINNFKILFWFNLFIIILFITWNLKFRGHTQFFNYIFYYCFFIYIIILFILKLRTFPLTKRSSCSSRSMRSCCSKSTLGIIFMLAYFIWITIYRKINRTFRKIILIQYPWTPLQRIIFSFTIHLTRHT